VHLPYQQEAAHEMGERVAETSDLTAAAFAVSIQDMQRQLRDSSRRIRDSHKIGMRDAGMPISNEGDGDEMGHIIITGDIVGNEGVRALAEVAKAKERPQQLPAQPSPVQTQQQPSQQPMTPPKTPLWQKAVAVAALVAAGAAIPPAAKLALAAIGSRAETHYDIEKFVPISPTEGGDL